MASIQLRLTRVVDLTNRRSLKRTGIRQEELISPTYAIPQEVGLRAWEAGIEALLVPSAAVSTDGNLVVFPDNQHLRWAVQLKRIANR